MAVLVKYDNKATMTYHLTAYSVSCGSDLTLAQSSFRFQNLHYAAMSPALSSIYAIYRRNLSSSRSSQISPSLHPLWFCSIPPRPPPRLTLANAPSLSPGKVTASCSTATKAVSSSKSSNPPSDSPSPAGVPPRVSSTGRKLFRTRGARRSRCTPCGRRRRTCRSRLVWAGTVRRPFLLVPQSECHWRMMGDVS